MPAQKALQAAEVLTLHQGTADERRRELYGSPTVSAAEEARLWRAVQRACEDLALALDPLDPYRSNMITIANVASGYADASSVARRSTRRT